MPRGIPDASNQMWVEGQSIVLDLVRTAATTATVTWTIPTNYRAYDGMLVTASTREINPSNYPTDGVTYAASSDLTQPADTIGQAQVVFAGYGDVTTASVELTGLDPEQVYYVSGHLISNVKSYYTIGVRSYPQSTTSEVFAGDINKQYSPPTNPVVGDTYFDEVQKLVFFWNGTEWQPTTAHTVITGNFDPVPPLPVPEPPAVSPYPPDYPQVGDFFYNVTQKMLKLWTGSTWRPAESVQGVPNYDKQDVGTNLSYTARANLIDILKKQLGYPVVCVELIEDHYNIAINNALQEFRRRADNAYTKQYFFMTIQAFQDKYYLNEPSVGTDAIVDVLRIHRLNFLGLVNFAPDNIYAQQFLNQFYAPGVSYDLVAIHLIHAMSELFTQIFAGEIAFNWREASRELRIYKKFGYAEKVLIETSCEKMEQELLVDRWAQQWIQQWAEAELMFMLAHIRGKFATLPGPGGGLSLNSDSLLAEGQRLQEDCLRQIKDYEVGQNGPDTFFMPFVMG